MRANADRYWLAIDWVGGYNPQRLVGKEEFVMAVRNPFSTVRKIMIAQVLMAILVASGFFMQGGWSFALSPLLGALVAVLPNGYFAYRVFATRHLEAKGMVKAFYSGEAIKVLLTAAVFALVYQVPNINVLTLLVGYLAVLSVFWFALLWWRD